MNLCPFQPGIFAEAAVVEYLRKPCLLVDQLLRSGSLQFQSAYDKIFVNALNFIRAGCLKKKKKHITRKELILLQNRTFCTTADIHNFVLCFVILPAQQFCNEISCLISRPVVYINLGTLIAQMGLHRFQNYYKRHELTGNQSIFIYSPLFIDSRLKCKVSILRRITIQLATFLHDIIINYEI